MTSFVRLACSAGLLAMAAGPGWAQNLSGPAVPPTGAAAAHTAARSQADLSRAERQADQQRKAGEAQFKRRDDAMRKSMRSICSGC
jgi:hypothetical protein